MIIEKCAVGGIATNCYIAADEASHEGVVIDPGAEPERILALIKERGIRVAALLFTHGHFDHVGAAADLHEALGAPIWCHRDDAGIALDAVAQAADFGARISRAPEKIDFYLEDGVPVKLGPLTFQVMHTPGHTPGGVTLILDKYAFTGDSLFRGGIGRSDFDGGDHASLLKSIKQKIYTLPDDTVVHPGHGPSSTIGYEKRNNPFVRHLN